ncbi:hypothetical protein [Bosea sp. CS1GBMeth4]|uniref:hypothetical protein n=1 Tax=Bosea sp. CS1GBMeth4 TaxID=1892849 RepID=UPI001648F087|nr:hypothetical protein [Bosea sp. CS1GBMeth4]
MSPFLRRVGFILCFAIVTTTLHAQLSACPTIQIATQVGASQVSVEKPARARLTRAAQTRSMPRPEWVAAFV